jgi:hypothetical protein
VADGWPDRGDRHRRRWQLGGDIGAATDRNADGHLGLPDAQEGLVTASDLDGDGRIDIDDELLQLVAAILGS